MPRTCTICVHDDRPAIDMMLINGKPLRDIAGRFGTSKSALERHRADHLPATLVKAQAVEEVAQADDLLSQVIMLKTRALAILDKAEQADKFVPAIMAIREARGCVELLGELMQQLDRRPTLNLLIAPEWLATRSALVDALAPYPEARAAVAARMRELETLA